jgi:phage gp29-like protein
MSLIQVPAYFPAELKRASRWREYYNPLIGLTFPLVFARLQNYQIGIVSDLMWTYRFIEERDPVLRGVKARRLSAIEKLDWSIKTIPDKELPKGATAAQATAQATALREVYDAIDNLRDAVGHLALASFRGFAHLEKHYAADGSITHLEPVPQWNWARDGLFGNWYYNNGAFSVPGGPQSSQVVEIDPERFIVREECDPIDVIGIYAFLRKNLSQKDWDGFVETFGIPPIFIELPPNMPQDEQDKYQALAEQIIGDMRGTIPAGSKVQTVDAGARGTNPFRDHIQYNDEMIVLAGTSGKLTMLTASGSGTLAGHAHADTFDELAQAEAEKISELLQKQIDKGFLAQKFPGQKPLAYFELAAKEETNVTDVVTHAKELAEAGYAIEASQLSERTGYDLSDRAPVDKAAQRAMAGDATIGKPEGSSQDDGDAVANRALLNASDADADNAFLAQASKMLNAADAKSLKPVWDRLLKILAGPDDQLIPALKKLSADVPALAKKVGASNESVDALQKILGAATGNGLATEPVSKKKTKNRKSKK